MWSNLTFLKHKKSKQRLKSPKAFAGWGQRIHVNLFPARNYIQLKSMCEFTLEVSYNYILMTGCTSLSEVRNLNLIFILLYFSFKIVLHIYKWLSIALQVYSFNLSKFPNFSHRKIPDFCKHRKKIYITKLNMYTKITSTELYNIQSMGSNFNTFDTEYSLHSILIELLRHFSFFKFT